MKMRYSDGHLRDRGTVELDFFSSTLDKFLETGQSLGTGVRSRVRVSKILDFITSLAEFGQSGRFGEILKIW